MDTLTKHTPGPWEADQENRHGNITIQTQHECVSIALLSHQYPQMDGGRDFDMERANGRLLAAAPELLAALKNVRDNAQSDSLAMWEQVDAAIAKAEGRSA